MSVGLGGAFVLVQGGSAVYASLSKNTTASIVSASETTTTEVQIPLSAVENIPVENTPVTITSNIFSEDQIPQENQQKQAGYPNEEAVIQAPKKVAYSCPKPKKDFPDYGMENVGQNTAIPDSDYIPNDLVLLSKDATLHPDLCLRQEAADEFEAMIAAALGDKLTIRATSAFRDYGTQSSILKEWIKLRGQEAYLRVAKPGYSEHQLGMTIDLSGKSINYTSAADLFGTSPEAQWLEDNAATYGFVRSYPEGKELITGYMYEPWHYRYVGIDNALAIKKESVTLTEFLAALQKEKDDTIEVGG